MNRQEPAVNNEENPAEREVVKYLRAHPDFFARHDELLSTLHISHGIGGAVSLIQRQVEVLRGQVDALNRREREMHELARENEHLHGKLHRFTLSMIGARSLSDVMARLRAFLETEFKLELVVILWGLQARFRISIKSIIATLTAVMHMYSLQILRQANDNNK